MAKQWNPNHLSGCVQKCVSLLKQHGATGLALELIEEAAEHLDCVEKHDCKVYRSELKRGEARLRRAQGIKSWEYWLLQAGDRLLQPVPGIKNQATRMIHSAIEQFDDTLEASDVDLSETWIKWYKQHDKEVPAYLESQ
jgi:hypothetical protein